MQSRHELIPRQRGGIAAAAQPENIMPCFTDAFRSKYPDRTDAYTWWSYMGRAREKNVGWRIDYWILSNRLAERIDDVIIHKDTMGSDHCPLELQISL